MKKKEHPPQYTPDCYNRPKEHPEIFGKDWEEELANEFLFGIQNPVEGETYTLIGHRHNGTCEFECNKLEKLKSFIRSNFISRKEVEKAIEKMGKKEFIHSPIMGTGKHLAHPDICRGCQVQMDFLEALSDLRQELLEEQKEK